MKFEMSERWETDDLNVLFVHNFTDVREAVYFDINGDEAQRMANETYNEAYPMNSGQNLILNDTETREIYFVANGKPEPRMI